MKKYFATFLNILSAIAVIITIHIIDINYKNDTFTDILNKPKFEETDVYFNLINIKLNELFTNVSLKECFETDNYIDYNKIIALSDDDDGIKEWSLNDCMSIAINHGIFIDPSFNINKKADSYIPFDNNTYNITDFKYPTKLNIGVITEEKLIIDVLSALSSYYKTTRNLKYENTNFYYILDFSSDNEIIKEFSNTKLDKNQIINYDAYISASSKNNLIDSNITYIDPNIISGLRNNNPYHDYEFDLYCMIDTNYPYPDSFRVENNIYKENNTRFGKILTIFITSTLAYLFTLLLSLYYIFSTKKTVDDSRIFFHNIPTEIHLILYFLITALLIVIIKKISLYERLNLSISSNTEHYLYILIFYIMSITELCILSSKYANDTLIPSFLRANDNSTYTTSFAPSKSLFVIMLSIIVILSLISSYIFYLFTINSDISLFIISIVLIIFTIFFSIALLWLFTAFKNALLEQKKANDMRSSLIANVSHDIKTPLTSITNYSDLISSEIEKPSTDFKENLLHYSNVLIDKTKRLNELINDLIFDSKVTTGNLKLEMSTINIVEYIKNVNEEFTDKLLENGIKVIIESDNDEINIEADNKQLYRILQNLYTNIIKYALENSRVFVDIEEQNSRVIITYKNIQKEKLQVDPSTLKDRFVRGNVSRSTEGFGLGLSITDSLVKLMKGKFIISSVKDEFIAKIIFIKHA